MRRLVWECIVDADDWMADAVLDALAPSSWQRALRRAYNSSSTPCSQLKRVEEFIAKRLGGAYPWTAILEEPSGEIGVTGEL